MFITTHDVVRLSCDREFDYPVIVRIFTNDGECLGWCDQFRACRNIRFGQHQPIVRQVKLRLEYAERFAQDGIRNHNPDFAGKGFSRSCRGLPPNIMADT
jgi:hypothetical protein